MGMKWTDEQRKVIDLRGRSVLVSAAAGSGKTAVLVERIISMITDAQHPMDIDRLLVVTFTNAAAAEMRERVGKAIEAALESDPMNLHLQRQQTLVHNAKIMTIDSFCMDVIRNHFHKIDLEPGMRIGDEGEMTLLREDVCDALLEEFYASEHPAFLKFADSYSTAKSDTPVKEMILKLYDYSVSYPWPEEWLSSCVEQYEADTPEQLEEKPWVKEFLRYLSVRIRDLLQSHRELLAMTREMDGPFMYEGSIQDDIRQLEELLSCEHLTEWQEKISGIKFKMIGNSRKYEGSEEKKQAVAAGRDRMKKQIQELQKNYFAVRLERQLELLHKTGDMVKMLVELTLAFSEKFRGEKKKKHLMDFSDVEHYALDILVDAETKKPTETAKEYQEQFAEIMIDEYQDSNYVQETLLTAVSGISSGQENLFLVGDVKQSIYRFRLARPELFMEKYRSFTEGESDRQRIDLHRNFRSRREVVDTVNDIFYHIMSTDLGNVEYDASAALYVGADFPENPNPDCCQPEFLMITEDNDTEDRRMAEARVVAQRIRTLVEQEELPGIRYNDIVILLRSLSGWAETFQKVFDQEGIPLIVSSRTGYFSAQEVQTVLSMLRVLDNPCQDIPLAAVMKSRMGGFTSSELACIRSAFPGRAFYQCVQDFAVKEPSDMEKSVPDAEKIREKLCAFWNRINDFRARIPYTPIHLLIQEILEETGYRNYVTALPAGEQRRANLDMLVEKAIAYENTSYHGLFHFVRYIDRLMKYDVDYGEAETISEQENAVHLMSIHKSKGLEFPVVFVAGMGKQFNMTDMRSNMIFHPEYGIGLRCYDSEKRTKTDTLIRRIFALETKKENLGEELRVLYVALTRAKEKLILTGYRKAEEKVSSCLEKEEKLAFSDRFDATCYWDWVLPALGGNPQKYQVQIIDLADRVRETVRHGVTLSEERRRLENQLSMVDETILQQIDRQLCWQYPYAGKELKKQKVSVSELKHRAMQQAEDAFSDTEENRLFPEEIPTPYVPKFVQESEENVGARRGTAMHRFLECLNFSEVPQLSEWAQAREYLEELRQSMIARGRMEQEEAELVNLYQIFRFLKSEVAVRMCKSAKAGLLTKEKPFVMSVPATEAWEDADPDAVVLIQGIIDVFWEEEDGIVLLDYKTDRVNSENQLICRYETQLRLYAQALERNFGKRVSEILIYSFYFHKFVPIQTEETEETEL